MYNVQKHYIFILDILQGFIYFTFVLDCMGLEGVSKLHFCPRSLFLWLLIVTLSRTNPPLHLRAGDVCRYAMIYLWKKNDSMFLYIWDFAAAYESSERKKEWDL